MSRVTTDEVKEIISTSETELTPYIVAAGTLIDDLLVGHGLTTTQLKEIERWLAAHFLSAKVPKGQLMEQEIGETREKYAEGKAFGEALASTYYGQRALLLDTTGRLSNIGLKRAQFRAFP